MGLSFLTPMLLGGAALVAIPLALHLIMRRKPVPHAFPALRFLRERAVANRRRLRISHLFLLLLRMAALALLAQYNVAVLPGSFLARTAHGCNPGAGRLRLALVAGVDECVEAASRIVSHFSSVSPSPSKAFS